MKRVIFIFSLLICSLSAKAQTDLHFYADPTDSEILSRIHPGMKYGELKYYYDVDNYVPKFNDGHNPFWYGVASAVIPGLGECLSGEYLRGLGKTAAVVGLGFVGAYLLPAASEYYDADFLPTTCLLGAIVVYVWSVVDAVNIAKVKIMYMRDLHLLGIADVNLRPSFKTYASATGVVPTAGLSLSLTF